MRMSSFEFSESHMMIDLVFRPSVHSSRLVFLQFQQVELNIHRYDMVTGGWTRAGVCLCVVFAVLAVCGVCMLVCVRANV